MTAWWHILLIRFSDRLAKGVRGAPRDVMVAESVPKERLGSAYGLIQSMDSAGAIVGPLAALVLLARFGIRGVFLGRGSAGRAHRVGRDIRRSARRNAARRRAAQNWNATRRSQRRPVVRSASAPLSSYYMVLIAVTLFSLGNSSDMFLVMRAQNVGIPVATGAASGLVFNITYTLGSWPAGWFSDRFSRRWMAAAGYLIFAAVYFVFGRAPSTLAIWITMAVYGLYYALTQPVLKASGCRDGGIRGSGTRTGCVFLRDQRGHACGQLDYRRTVEALWCGSSVLLLSRTSSGFSIAVGDQTGMTLRHLL